MAPRSPRDRPTQCCATRRSSRLTSAAVIAVMLELSGVDVYYAKNHVLKGVTLKVNDGEVVALVGANAAGKTTTLRTIMGLKAPIAGSIVFEGKTMNDVATNERVH